ncbi:uncharacterized protein [Linepithema humile]|uniref:uncharacterized protein n=1 Tax=Linepithema humile TaxID=83485 RepID=UPI00351E0330
MDSQIKFASVRYFNDESKKIHIISIDKIKDFTVLDKYEDPYFVKRLNTITNEESLIAAQIMEVGTNEEDLKHNKQRYVFKKMRYSDAVQKILDKKEILEKENPEPNETQKETEFDNERTSKEGDENIIKEKLKASNRDDIIFERNREKLFDIPIALEKKIQSLQDENKKLQLENNNLKNDIFFLKEKLHSLKTKKQLFPEEIKRPASPSITSTPKKMRSETVNVPLQDAVFSEPSTSQLRSEQSLLQDDFCIKVLAKNNKTTQKAKSNKKKQRKKAKKIKSQRKIKEKNKNKGSDLDYDSDQYIGLTDKENMTTWNDEVSGTTIKMMHLRYGISIPYITWKEIKKLKRPSLFVRQLSRALWGVHKLMNRAVLLERSKNRLPNRSPRKPLTPVKKAVLKKCYSAFIEMHHKKEKKQLINKWRRYS